MNRVQWYMILATAAIALCAAQQWSRRKETHPRRLLNNPKWINDGLRTGEWRDRVLNPLGNILSRPQYPPAPYLDTFMGGSGVAFNTGEEAPNGHLKAEPLYWGELRKLLVEEGREDSENSLYDDSDVVYEYVYDVVYTSNHNTRYTVCCFCFPSDEGLCSCGDFTSQRKDTEQFDPVLEFDTVNYLRRAQSAILYIEEDSTPDNRFMDLFSFMVFINGTFPSEHKWDELKDYNSFLLGKACNVSLTKNCHRKDKRLPKPPTPHIPARLKQPPRALPSSL